MSTYDDLQFVKDSDVPIMKRVKATEEAFLEMIATKQIFDNHEKQLFPERIKHKTAASYQLFCKEQLHDDKCAYENAALKYKHANAQYQQLLDIVNIKKFNVRQESTAIQNQQ